MEMVTGQSVIHAKYLNIRGLMLKSTRESKKRLQALLSYPRVLDAPVVHHSASIGVMGEQMNSLGSD